MNQLEVFFAGIVLGTAVGAAVTAILLEVIAPYLQKRFAPRADRHPADEVGYETQPPRVR